MTELSRAEFDARLTSLDQALDRHADRIVVRLDAINGRVRSTETRVAVLEDRDATADATGRATAARWGAGIAALVSGVVSWLITVGGK